VKRSVFNAILRDMEHVRMESYEAESAREEKRLVRQYAQLYQSIKPFLDGVEILEEDAPTPPLTAEEKK